MNIEFSIPNLINFFFIASGIGICGLSFRQVSVSSFLRVELKRYFQAFFLLIILYISSHLARQLMDGHPGAGIGTAIRAVTFIEMIAAGLMAFMMALLILAATQEGRRIKSLEKLLLCLLGLHVILLIYGQFNEVMYYFDSENVYHRGPAYLLTNLCPLAMMAINIVLLMRYRKNLRPKVASAFWVYTLAPIIAAIIQNFSYGVQFIIIATVGAAVYMFEIIIEDQTEQHEMQQMEASRLDTELSMATRIQADMLPNIFPAFPERDEFDVYASMTPAKEVGGDFYDFFLIDQNKLGIVMADVSGKGIPAALFMMISKILVQNYALTGRSPKEVLESVNEQICKNNREDMFVTVWFGILDLQSGNLKAANAGHEYPAIKKSGGDFELIHDKHGIAVGAMEGLKYKEYELQLEEGSKLFLYTDGVAEATDKNEELFGTDRMIEALKKGQDGEPKDILAAVQEAVNEFVKDAPQFDDLTMLALEYKGKGKESNPCTEQ